MTLRTVLGLLLATMALGQLASFDAMPAILTSYGLTSGAVSTALAVVLIGAEAVTALWFLVRPRSRAVTPVRLYTGVAVVWSVLAAQAFARGFVLDNCGCFGTYLAQPLRWYVLVEDALMVLYAWLLWRGLRRARPNPLTDRTSTAAPTPQENH
ncbi:Methylamine utilization protein MauE [Streptomyces sp. S4.7]|uniref:MauE/DoxX family redox-associated membrane protein n=1 Tax=Streptomyces sp. S4.7 TaxID=2705439 RepID=UPI001399147A|nr:MauE/DoxX family redox-associated membrane protein [Streptomyces sp. S4.7]QHY94402.1 Methylamine utilization protein MauE [Streptomyces sp. S4.7]